MSVILLILLIAPLMLSKGNKIELFPEGKNENSEYELFCTDPRVKIDFSDVTLSNIKEQFLSSPLIQCLNFSNNNIYSLATNAFNNLPNLKFLQISSNSFSLSNLFINNFKELEILISEDNTASGSTNGEVKIGGIFPKLRKLFLRDNNIYDMKVNSKYSFPLLTHLYLSGNNLNTNDFDWLPESLEYLDLVGHRLETLTLKNLRNLKQLFVDESYDNSLTDIYFENLDSLKYLSVPSNQINQIFPSTFTNTSSLLYLDLSDNNIDYIVGNAFDSMQDLRFLNLSNNKLEIIQVGTFDKLTNLQTLVLEKNIISMFPTISNETKLESLVLNCNKIKSITGGTFFKMPYLESLYLHDNEISYIDQESFAGLVKLKTLTLSNNVLSVLPNNWILPMISLEELDLSGNIFKDFENLALNNTSPLKNMYLSKQIKFIKAQDLFNVPKNVTINLDEDFKFIKKCLRKEDKYQRRYHG